MSRYFERQGHDIVRQDFSSHIYGWCLENTIPIVSLAPEDVLVVFYENLVMDPTRELDRIREYLGVKSGGQWRTWRPDLSVIDRASAMTLPSPDEVSRSPDKGHRISWWTSEVPSALIEDALLTVDRFGLSHIYGEGIRPLLGPDGVLQGRRPPIC